MAAEKPSPDAFAEYNAASEYLVNALYLKNPKIISVSFLAYKHVALGYDDAAPHVRIMAQLLKRVL